MAIKDVFHAFLLKNAKYDGVEEIPVIKTSKKLPNKLVSFSKCLSTKDFDQWVMFYEYDSAFIRLWNNPTKYLPILKKFNGVITPDFSLYRNMPLVMQKWSTFQGKAIGNWLQENDIEVIPNVRFADERSYKFCFSGVEKNSTVCIGSNGCVKTIVEKYYFVNGFKEMIKVLSPNNVIIYGSVPVEIKEICDNLKINIISFKTETEIAHSTK